METLTVPKEWMQTVGSAVYWTNGRVLVDRKKGTTWLIAPEIRDDGLTYRRLNRG